MAESISFHFECGDFEPEGFYVVRFTGEEGLSSLYRFDIELLSLDADIDIDHMQNQSSTFTITGGRHERQIQGVIASVDILDQRGEHALYRVTLVPRVWQLTLTQVNAIYLDRKTPEVIRGVLEDQLGLASVDYTDGMHSEYRRWPFRMQYQESYWDFLCRLMERDGIYYFFTAGDSSEQIVLADSLAEQPAIEEPELIYTAGLGMSPLQEEFSDSTVDSLILRQQRLPNTVWVQNYNDEKPSTQIREKAEIDPAGTGEIQIYGQNVLDADEAATIAGLRAEAYRSTKAVHHGQSTTFRLAAGHHFELSGHPRRQHNGKYQVTRIEHSGHNPSVLSRIGQSPPPDTPIYENRFTAIAGAIQYRAPCTTAWPNIRGTLNARIDAATSGEFAEIDEEGRYHVIFPFQRGFTDTDRSGAGKASHWVRLVQPYSGEREGMHFPLRKGTRVLIGFIGGNPDLPVITGAVPNSEHISVTRDENQAKGNITTQRTRLEFDDEYPRIKLECLKSRTYFHIGSSNAAGDGIVLATQGLNRRINVGGSNHVFSTKGWPEDLDTGAKLRYGETGLTDAANLEAFAGRLEVSNTEVDWSEMEAGERQFEWARKSVFDFPAKHVKPSQRESSDGVTATNHIKEDGTGTTTDGRHDLMLARTIGVAYHYRLGIDFRFEAEGGFNECFDYGPKFSYTAAEHGVEAGDLRQLPTATFPRFEDPPDTFGRSQKPAYPTGLRCSNVLVAGENENDALNKWKGMLRKGRVSVNQYDLFKWHNGNIYDFGGCWEYNLGNGYEENHIKQDDLLNESGLDKDLLAKGGPLWYTESSPWTDLMDSSVKERLDKNKNSDGQHEMLVSKTFGDVYDYHLGTALEVQVGPSLSIKKAGPNIEKKYKGYSDHLVEHVRAEPSMKEESRFHPDSGVPLFYGRESWGIQGHGAGKHSFSAEFAPSASLAIKADFSKATSINVGATLGISVNIGSMSSVGIDLINKNSLNVTMGLVTSLDFSLAGKLKIENSKVDWNSKALTYTTEMQKLETALNTIEKRQNMIMSELVKVANLKVNLENSGIIVESAPINMKN